MNKVFIAYNRELETHVLFEVVPSGASRDYLRFEPEQAFNLISWKTLDGLMTTLNEAGPLVSCDLIKDEKRCWSIDEVIQGLGDLKNGSLRDFGKYDYQFLYDYQVYLDGGIPRDHPSKKSTLSALELHDLFSNENIAALKRWQSEDPNCKVVIEPITDLVFARNFGSILLRLISYYNAGKEEPFKDAGFEGDRDSYFRIKLMNDHQNSYISGDWYLSMSNFRMPSLRNMFSHATTKSIVFYENASSALYLAVSPSENQRRLLEELMEGITRTLFDLRDSQGRSIGFELSMATPLTMERSELVQPNSLFGWLMYVLLYRFDAKVTQCVNCGNGIIYKTTIRDRKFCCPYCKNLFNKRRRLADR